MKFGLDIHAKWIEIITKNIFGWCLSSLSVTTAIANLVDSSEDP